MIEGISTGEKLERLKWTKNKFHGRSYGILL